MPGTKFFEAAEYKVVTLTNVIEFSPGERDSRLTEIDAVANAFATTKDPGIPEGG